MPLSGLSVDDFTSSKSGAYSGGACSEESGQIARSDPGWFEAHPKPMWVYDLSTLQVLTVNEAALDHLRYTREQFLTLRHFELESNDTACARRAFTTPGLVPSVPRQFLRSDGTAIEACVTLYDISMGTTRARVVSLDDVTARLSYDRRVSQLYVDLVETNTHLAAVNLRFEQTNQRLEQVNQRFVQANRELETANRTQEEFLGILSHELRTPLNAIVLWTRLLRNRPLSESDLAEITDMIDANVRVQKRLIEDLLDLSALFAGRLHLRPIETNLCSVVEDASDLAGPRALDAEVTLRLTSVPDPCMLVADPVRLRQALMHVLDNAIKFSPRGSTVDLSIVPTGTRLRVVVTDHGDGISTDFLPHVFDPFRQADASTHRRHDGLGMGLSIVRGLVELHGGTVEVVSPGPGDGTTVTIDLPFGPSPPSVRNS